MNSLLKDLPDDAILLKQLLEKMLSERESVKGKTVHLEEKNALLPSAFSGASQSRQPIQRPHKWP